MDGGGTEDAPGGPLAILGGLERWWAYWAAVAWCIALCGSVLLNATLLVAFVRRPGLRTISNRFVMNLIGSNLLAMVVFSALLIMSSSGVTSLGYSSSVLSFCKVSEAATALVTTSSILSVLLIGVDQYLAVVDPLRYRTRIDRLRCNLLIGAVWLLALVFAVLAGLNPEPRSLWRLCGPDDSGSSEPTSGTETLRLRASIVLSGNATESANLEIDGEFRFSEESERNLTARARSGAGTSSYGLVYALVYALLGYLLPFLAICWIYASIYRAARNNSERTRRNGSRPVLSSGSFSEEAGGYRADCSVEDFRRIPKISSLSSIEENSEATASQLGCAAQDFAGSEHHLHGRDADVAEREDEEEQEEEEGEETERVAGDRSVIFTVGETQVGPGRPRPDDAKDSSTKSKVPISALRAKFLSEQSEEDRPELAHSKFPAVSEQRRKSSHDLMYEEMMLGYAKQPYEYDERLDNSSDEDEDEEDEENREEEEEEERHNYEEAVPLSASQGFVSAEPVNSCSTRSISVNFDLGDGQQHHQQQQSTSAPGPGSPSHPLPIVTITPPGQKPAASAPLHRVSSVRSTHGYINNLKYKISNGSLFKYREETRAARVSALVVVMGFICWTPYVYLLVTCNLPEAAVDLESQPARSPSSLLSPDAAALGFLVLASYVTPLLFGYRSRRVKRELQRFFCFRRELSYKNNRSLMAKKVLKRRHSGTAGMLGQFIGDAEHAAATPGLGRYSIFSCMCGRTRWPKDKVQFVQVPETALAVETCRSSFSSGASTQISSTSTDEC